MLQLDAALIDALHAARFEIAIETNGTLPVPAGIDWGCVSPKAEAPLVVTHGNELKVVVPQPHQSFAKYEQLDFDAGHRIPDHRSVCCHLHGHRYALEITLRDTPVCAEGAPDCGMLTVALDCISTVEHLAAIAFDALAPVYNRPNGLHLQLERVRLFETPTCWAEVKK